MQISGSCTGYWAPRWQRHSETTAIKILCSKQAASLFSRCSNAVKNVGPLFRSFCTPIYALQLWWTFRKWCMQRLRVACNFGCRALYNLPWRASVSSHDSSGSMYHSYIWGCIIKKIYTWVELSWFYLAIINIQLEKTQTSARTPGHWRKRKVVESMPLSS